MLEFDYEFAEQRGEVLQLRLLTQPNASKSRFAELIDGRIKLRIAAPAVDGQANRAVIRFLATAFGVPKRDVRISLGETGRRKTVLISKPQKDPFS